MHLDDPLKDLLREEETASSMARRATAALDAGDEAVFSAELGVFCAYLATDLEAHLAREEAEVFPVLEARGFAEEVAEAKHQHRDLRGMRAQLASACTESRTSARHVLGAVAELLARHVRYEADFMYVDLMQAEVESFRTSLDAELQRGAARKGSAGERRTRPPDATAHGLLHSLGMMDANKARDTMDAVDCRRPSDRVSAAEVAVEAFVGAAAGAATGVLAGPPGVVAGAVIGGAIGAAAGAALHRDHLQHQARDEQLDRDIGVIGGNIGEAPPDAPPAKFGAFHTASMGVGCGPSPVPSEGPMQNLDED